MSKRDPEVALRQMLAYSREAVELSASKNRQDLDCDRLLNLALTRLVEMLGEAANRVPEEIRNRNPDLPWQQMIAARNHLIHGYDSVDFDILWAIIQTDLPLLIVQLERILKQVPQPVNPTSLTARSRHDVLRLHPFTFRLPRPGAC